MPTALERAGMPGLVEGQKISVSSTLGVSTLTPDGYIVVFHEGDWKIKRSGGLSARYRTQQDALLDALHSARKAGKCGEAVEVLLEGDINPIVFSWSHCFT
jgi:hypothetical protein